ncbi:elongation factor G [Pseudoleptotrichia goodfellowii]|uniref:Putative translation elongation factor G n=1 Tax=Pseudoleptotrichia goodfellowii F0264 TaxID=596323 RepID=D0GIW4_9FUSO|nr:elongation factor G [Pseudoleptotrichia goodfellowii]EEY35951.1 putative translation elongation factor G [Pseudoleptotrichia goodfellowii F0264]
MRIYESDSIRNVAILGHSGAGKSNMTEALEFTAGLTTRISNPNDNVKISSSTTLHAIEYQSLKFNFLDIPGYTDFFGELESGLAAADGAIIIVDGTTDLSVGTETSLELTDSRNIPRFIFVNKIDSEKADYEKILSQLREKYGKRIAPFHVPWGKAESFKGHINVVDMYAREYDGKECHNASVPDDMNERIQPVREMLLEAVAETSEELMDKYFNGEEFTTAEIHKGLREGVLNGNVIPVICGSTFKNIGLHTAFDMVRDYLPAPRDNKKVKSEKKEFVCQVFKTVIDSFLGRVSYAKVLSGELKPESEIYNINKRTKERVGKISTMVMDKLTDVPKAVYGDIIIFTKLSGTQTSDTLSNNEKEPSVPNISFPKAQMLVAIEPLNKADDEKISTGLQKLIEEDASFMWDRNMETGQTVLGVQGDLHTSVLMEKLKNKFGVEVKTEELKVPYRETIKGQSDVQGKYKKQSGGHGQYGDVKIKFMPSEEHFVFEETVVGGSVPKSYIPAVEKGLKESIAHGVLAGYPVTNIKAVLYDGSYHDVDSSEMSFKIAANLAFKKGMLEAKPVLLEPIMELSIIVPEEYIGDIMGDINKKRGRVSGMESHKGTKQKITAEAPMAETFKYANDLKAMTQGRGYFEMKLLRYEEVPYDLAKKIIDETNAEKEN